MQKGEVKTEVDAGVKFYVINIFIKAQVYLVNINFFHSFFLDRFLVISALLHLHLPRTDGLMYHKTIKAIPE